MGGPEFVRGALGKRSKRACAVLAMAAQSWTIFRAQSRRLLNRACHDCKDLESSMELGAEVGVYRFGKGDSDTREDAPGEVAACDVIRIS